MVQFGDVVQRSLWLDHQQAVEGFGGDLAGEAPQRLLTPVAGEQQQAEARRLHGVDHALEDLADPRPGQRGDQHPDDPGAAPRQSDGSRARYVAEFLDDPSDPCDGRRVELALAVEDPGDSRLADAGMCGHISDGDRHVRLRSSADRANSPVRNRFRNRLRRKSTRVICATSISLQKLGDAFSEQSEESALFAGRSLAARFLCVKTAIPGCCRPVTRAADHRASASHPRPRRDLDARCGQA